MIVKVRKNAVNVGHGLPLQKKEEFTSVECPYKCGVKLEGGELFQHFPDCEKLNSGTVCPYVLIGCNECMTSDPKERENHLIEHGKDPRLLLDTIFKQQHEIITLESRLKEMDEKVKELDTSVSKKVCELDEMRIRVKSLSDTMKIKHEERKNMEKDLTKTLSRMIEEASKLDEIDSKIEKVSTLRSSLQSTLHGEGFDEKSLKKLEVSATILKSLEKEVAYLNATVADNDLKLNILENTSKNGRLIWRINNYMYRDKQAELGKVTTYHSSPCYTDPCGYKFCIRAYPNGDGQGKNTHFSIYFVLMKNSYDDLLEWPFYRKVTFKLLNHRDVTKTKKETFITERKSSSFQKPVKDINIAAGCPKFITKESLYNEGFLVDDCIFIEAIVEHVQIKQDIAGPNFVK